MNNTESKLQWPKSKFSLVDLHNANNTYSLATVRIYLTEDLGKGKNSEIVQLAETVPGEGRGRRPSLYILRSKVGNLAVKSASPSANTKAQVAKSKEQVAQIKAQSKAQLAQVRAQSKEILAEGLKAMKQIGTILRNFHRLATGKNITVKAANIDAPKAKVEKSKKTPKVKKTTAPAAPSDVSEETKRYENLKQILTAPIPTEVPVTAAAPAESPTAETPSVETTTSEPVVETPSAELVTT
jgi:hypothetical protein